MSIFRMQFLTVLVLLSSASCEIAKDSCEKDGSCDAENTNEMINCNEVIDLNDIEDDWIDRPKIFFIESSDRPYLKVSHNSIAAHERGIIFAIKLAS